LPKKRAKTKSENSLVFKRKMSGPASAGKATGGSTRMKPGTTSKKIEKKKGKSKQPQEDRGEDGGKESLGRNVEGRKRSLSRQKNKHNCGGKNKKATETKRGLKERGKLTSRNEAGGGGPVGVAREKARAGKKPNKKTCWGEKKSRGEKLNPGGKETKVNRLGGAKLWHAQNWTHVSREKNEQKEGEIWPSKEKKGGGKIQAGRSGAGRSQDPL